MSILAPDIGARELDPFGFFIGHASAIKGLGGPDRGPDPAYAFHTPYMEYRAGPVVFTLRFEGLAARFGELVIHVNSFVPGSGAHALLVTMMRLSLSDLAASGGEVAVRINALPDVGFAIFGYFPEGADASASGLTIVAEELGDDGSATIPAEALLPSRFGSVDLSRPATLVTEERLSFRHPVSQPMTAAQLQEDDYRACLAALHLKGHAPAADWKQAFTLQVLDRYGFIGGGAHGLALGDSESPLAACLIARGCSITAARRAAEQDATAPMTPRHYPAICADAMFDARCSQRSFDPQAIDDGLAGHDFLWSIDTACRLGSVAAGRSFIERSMAALRPRGLAVHLFDIAAEEGAPNGAIPRQRVEAIALSLISQAHEVSQLGFAGGALSSNDTVPFGLIVRRGR